jgi:hypothetical protein
VREQIRQMIIEAHRPPRTAADHAECEMDQIAAQAVRLARLAAALHVSQAAPLLAACGPQVNQYDDSCKARAS